MKHCFLYTILVLFLFSSCEKDVKKSTKRQNQTAATLVEVIIIKNSSLPTTIKSIGTLMANESVSLSTQAGGSIDKINFEEGSQIKKGQLLLRVFNADIQAELKEVKARQNLAEIELSRNKKLFEAEGISQEVVDRATANFDELNAKKEKLEAEILKTEVYAPFNGTIGLRKVSKGDYLSANTPFANLVDISSIKVDFSLAEQYAHQIKKGDSISFKSSNSSILHKAIVYAVEPKIDEGSRTIDARAIIANKNKELLPGTFVDVFLTTNQLAESIVVPNQSIVPILNGSQVFTVKNGKITSQKVETGIRDADKIQIKKGLQVGDTLVTTGLMQIREGMPVRIRIDKSY